MATEFDAEKAARLYLKEDGLTTPVLRFPMGQYAGDLPDLVFVRSTRTGRALIAGTAWWGSPNMDHSLTAFASGHRSFAR